MTTYTLMAILSYVIILVALYIITMGVRRFVSGEFKDVIKTLLIALWFMVLPYSLLLIRETMELDPTSNETIGWVIYGCMVIVGLYILKSSILFYRFSKVFGFADNTK